MRHALLFVLLAGIGPAQANEGFAIPTREQFVGPFAPLVLADQPLAVGLVRVVSPPARALPIALVALETDTLKVKWRVGDLGDAVADIVHLYTHLGRVDDTLIVAQADRRVRGIHLKDGTVRWSVPLTDVPTQLCVVDGQVLVDVLDQQRKRIDPATGRARSLEAWPASCARSGQPGPVGPQGQPTGWLEREEKRDRALVAGLERDATVRWKASERALALLHKAPGTSIPYVGGLRGDKLTWHRALDVEDRFAAKPETPEVVAIRDNLAVVAYQRRLGQARVQAIDLTNGRALWDVAVPHPEHEVNSLSIAGERVLVGHWTYLESLDLRTGTPTGSFGVW